MTAKNEVWQIMVDGQIYETDFDGLKEWVAEGCFHLTDKVKKGSLTWIEAGKVPMLRRLFQTDAAPAPAGAAPMDQVNGNGAGHAVNAAPSSCARPDETVQPDSSRSAGGYAGGGHTTFEAPSAAGGQREFIAPMPPVPAGYRPQAVCYNHPGLPPKFMCKSCGNTSCDDCVRYANGRIPLCPVCGDLCELFEKVRDRAVREHFRRSGFGFEDFGSALAYPFKHPVSLVVGALVYGLLLIAGFFGNVAAFMMVFGCMTLTIRQIAWGRLDRCFMPEDDFSFWDDMIHPAILGIGITIVTWGPAGVLAIILAFSVMSSFRDANDRAMKGAQTDGSQVTQQDFADLGSSDQPTAERAAKKIEAAQHPPTAQSVSAETEKQSQQMVMKTLAASLPLVGLLLLGLIWGFLYYPMALTIAGYTQQFGSVINPLVGLDTIKRMGGTYVKAFLMYVAITVAGVAIIVFVSMLTAPFDMPIVGNLPGKVINGVVTFYTSLVIACILGLSLFKSSDKLNIVTD